jgi:hypothetical protein
MINGWRRTDAPQMIGLVESMPQHQAHAQTMEDIQPLSPLVDLQRPGIAVLLAHQQEEYDGYLLGRPANETPKHLVRLRAAQQAAQNVIPSARNDLAPQYSYWSRIGFAAVIAVSILLILKLRYS